MTVHAWALFIVVTLIAPPAQAQRLIATLGPDVLSLAPIAGLDIMDVQAWVRTAHQRSLEPRRVVRRDVGWRLRLLSASRPGDAILTLLGRDWRRLRRGPLAMTVRGPALVF